MSLPNIVLSLLFIFDHILSGPPTVSKPVTARHLSNPFFKNPDQSLKI